MQKTSAIKRVSRLAFAAMLAVAMCAPVCAYAAEPQAAEPEAASAPAAAFAVTMQQGNGEAKGYDSISAALFDVADYDPATNSEGYVITLNTDIEEHVTIPANKKVTIDLNGKWLSFVAHPHVKQMLVVRSQYAAVKDSAGGGGIMSSYCNTVLIEEGAALTVSDVQIAPSHSYRGIVNNGTLTMTSGYVKGGESCAILNNGTATISGGTVTDEYTAIANNGKLTIEGGSVESNMGEMGAAAVFMEGKGSLVVSGGQIISGGTAVAAYGTASVTVSGGSIEGDDCGIEAYGAVGIDISGGSLSSLYGHALSVGAMGVNKAVTATISGGNFASAPGKKAIDRTSTATVTLSGGTFNVANVSDICDSPVIADGCVTHTNADGTVGVHRHDFGGKWTSDADGHWKACGVCGLAAEKAPHTFEWVIDKPATATEAGSKHEQCTECGFAKAAVEIPADPSLGEQGGDQGGDSGQQGGDQGGQSGQGQQSGQSNQGQGLPQTGDASAALTVSMVLFSLTSAALLFLARRRTA